MKNVLIVNQSAELYGADKAILELIENYPAGYNPIVAVHHEGPLKDLLEARGIKVILTSVIKVKRGILSPLFFLRLPFEVFGSFRKIKKSLGPIEIDLVHSNAISVFIGAFYARFFRKPHLWHVHEIIEHPQLLAKAYPKIVYFFSDTIVFNSKATFAQFEKIKPKVGRKADIIYNGQSRSVPVSSKETISQIRRDLFGIQNPDATVIGLVGRISRLKGQILLLEAFAQICEKFPDAHLVYIGSAPDGQEHFVHNLENRIDAFNLGKRVTVLGFQQDVWKIYDALDIATVPSTEPESFGLVATEAMLSSKPVIAAEHGGLVEIVEHAETGILFEPGNQSKLRDALETLLSNPEKAREMGRKGKIRVETHFSTGRFVQGFEKAYANLLKD